MVQLQVLRYITYTMYFALYHARRIKEAGFLFALHHASSPNFHTDSPRCLCLHIRCRMYLIGRIHSAVGYSHSLFFRCRFAEQLVQDDSREGRGSDGAESKVTELETRVTNSHRERNSRRNQVTTC